MLALRLAFLLAVVCGFTGDASAPTNEETRAHSRTKRGAGGLLTIEELTQTLLGFCKTMDGVTKALETYPLNPVGEALFKRRIPIPNIQFLDRLNLIRTVRNGLIGVQKRLTARLKATSDNFDQRNLTRQIEALRNELNANTGSMDFNEDEEYFDIPSELEPTRAPKGGRRPGLLMTMRDLFELQETICPTLDFFQTTLTRSPIAFLHLERLPIPLPDRQRSINLIRAFDLYNLTGRATRILG